MRRKGREPPEDFDRASRREWLETNGIGGFASSSVALCNTRRYHGLLVAALNPPGNRRVLAANLGLTVRIGNEAFELDTNQYADTVHPCGYGHIASFAASPWPTWVFEIPSIPIRVRQELLMLDGRNATVIRLTLIDAPGSVRFEARPRVASRDLHSLAKRDDVPDPVVSSRGGQIEITWPDGRAGLFLAHNGDFEGRPDWYYNLLYERERERGYDFREDLYCPGTISWEHSAGRTGVLVFSDTPIAPDSLGREIDTERQRRATEESGPLDADTDARLLSLATRHFLVRDADQRWNVIAGYPWFGTWGRDTLISLPGLTLTTGRYAVARSVLQSCAAQLSRGMIPNCLGGPGHPPAYNSVDAALWFVWAVGAYRRCEGAASDDGEWFPAVREILANYERGTRYGIHLDGDGLISAGEPGTQLTWMDAAVNGEPVTPRVGKPVEIQALWRHALGVGTELAGSVGSPRLAEHYAELAARAEAAFEPAFWNAESDCCYDLIAPDGRADTSIRPNQVFVVSLSPSLLSAEKREAVVRTVTAELLTPAGLRTLSPKHPKYQGRYAGDPPARDLAYHQGTVWPWLIGHFADAYLSVHHDSAAARRQVRRFLDPTLQMLRDQPVGLIGELADGDAPHAPAGCIAQAWSVAETLRALVQSTPDK